MKRFAVIFTSLVMAVAFIGCGSTPEPKEDAMPSAGKPADDGAAAEEAPKKKSLEKFDGNRMEAVDDE